jgi:hypothetical protein
VLGVESPGAAAGSTTAPTASGFQPDVTIAQRGDRVPAGEDLYSADAVGQTRSVLLTNKQVLLVVRIENDGTGQCSYAITGTHGTNGFDIQYLEGPPAPRNGAALSSQLDVTAQVIDGSYVLTDVRPGATRTLTVRVAAQVDVSLGAKQEVLVRAVSTTEPDQLDGARATVTKVTEPLGP